jgi:hypothetical protein
MDNFGGNAEREIKELRYAQSATDLSNRHALLHAVGMEHSGSSAPNAQWKLGCVWR